MSELKYKRVLLKLSGEALAGETKFGVNEITIGKICDKIKELVDLKAEVAIVVGGGNFWRGKNGHEMERTTSDYMGMLATCMNGLALQDALESRGVPARLQTAVEMRTIAALNAALIATSVLPYPTSPHKSLSIGCGFSISFFTSCIHLN